MKRLKSIGYIVLLFIGVAEVQQLRAQADPFLRLEFEVKSDEADYRIIPCGSQGMMLHYPTTVTENEYNFWVFDFYDRAFQEKWTEDVPLLKKMEFQDYFLTGDTLWLYFYIPEAVKGSGKNFQMVSFSLTDGKYELYSGRLPEEALNLKIASGPHSVWIGMNFENHHAGVFRFDLKSYEMREIVRYAEQQAEIEDLKYDTASRRIGMLTSVYSGRNPGLLAVNIYTPAGQPVDSTQIVPEEGRKFNSARFSRTSSGKYLIVGTYGFFKSGNDEKFFSNETSGFYLASISKPGNPEVRYENFLELENMTGYLKSREYQQALKKAEKNRDKKGDSEVAVSYNLLLHDIIEHDSNFYFVAEAYYEDYHMVTNTYYDFYGRAMPVSYNVFDGYRWFNAFITSYNANGEKRWDNGMEIFNILSFDLEPRVVVWFPDDRGDEIVMAYNRDGKISAKIINGPETVEGVEQFPLETTYNSDKVLSDTKSSMVHWYDNYFLAYGFQTIRNNSLPAARRTVFYINKLVFR